MSSKRPRVLIDVDGPLTESFVQRACDLICQESDGAIQANPADVDAWDLMASLKVPDDVSERVYKHLRLSGLAGSMTPNEGAVSFMKSLQTWAEVYVVTSPLGGSTTWQHERETWLMHWFGVPAKRVCQVHDKFIVVGDFFIDDKLSHLQEWQEAHPGGKAILWRVPPNRHDRWPLVAENYLQLEHLLKGEESK